MTTTKQLTPTSTPLPASDDQIRIQFPEFSPRDDMQNIFRLHDPAHIPALRTHFGNPDTTVVLGEVPIGWTATGERTGLRIPDLLIAFNIRRAAVVAVMGYSITEHGKPPDFVLEIASPTTARRDEIDKPGDYADFGVPEYWRFDHEWGQNYTTGLAGDRLVNGVYQPIPIHQVAPEMHWGHSDILNLDLCWEYGELRFYDPAAQRYLDTFDSIHYARIAAEDARDAAHAARITAEESRDAEQAARIAAESARNAAEESRDAEQAARITAEESLDAAQAQIAQLQAEIARLRANQLPN